MKNKIKEEDYTKMLMDIIQPRLNFTPDEKMAQGWLIDVLTSIIEGDGVGVYEICKTLTKSGHTEVVNVQEFFDTWHMNQFGEPYEQSVSEDE